MSVNLINPPNMSRGAYSHAAVVSGGRTVYISGQVAIDANGLVVGTTLAEQTEQAFKNLGAVLDAAGATFADIVKLNTYVRDLTAAKAKQVREVRSRYLGAHLPASTLVGTPGLVSEDMLIEVEAVAVIRQ